MLKNGNPGHKLTADERKRGGSNSGKRRREKKELKELANDCLNGKIAEIPKFKKLAQKIGLGEEESVKKLFTVLCLLNTMQYGNVSDLMKMAQFLGETDKDKNADVIKKLDAVLEQIEGNI